MLTRQQEGVYIRNMLGENIGRRSETAEIKPSKEDVIHLYNGYRNLLDNYSERVEAEGLKKFFTLGGWDKFSTKVEIEGKNIDLGVLRVNSNRSNKPLIVDVGERTDFDESISLQLSKNGTASLIYSGRSLLDETLDKVLGRESPAKKNLSLYVEALDIVKKKFPDFPQNNPNKV
jgi:hypothetical protein